MLKDNSNAAFEVDKFAEGGAKKEKGEGLGNESEDAKRGEGFILGTAYSGPDFRPSVTPSLEKAPTFVVDNVSLLPILMEKKPVKAALQALTWHMQEGAVAYCKAQRLNCNDKTALRTAISVALRTSAVASMLRQFSASLSAVEVNLFFCSV